MGEDRDLVLEGIEASRRAGWARAYQAQAQAQQMTAQSQQFHDHLAAVIELLIEGMSNLLDMTIDEVETSSKPLRQNESASEALISMWTLGVGGYELSPFSADFECPLIGCDHTFAPPTELPVYPDVDVTNDREAFAALTAATETARAARYDELLEHARQHLDDHGLDDVMANLKHWSLVARQQEQHLRFVAMMLNQTNATLANIGFQLRGQPGR